ncbi:MAG: hypothetical protein ACRD08_03280 [Acidimicrobiales bacterium]
MSVFIAWPWLALIPAALFYRLSRGSGRRLASATALAWALYALYEYAMLRRWLCSGECNIRIDLLLIYPVLLIASLGTAIGALATIVRRRRPSA